MLTTRLLLSSLLLRKNHKNRLLKYVRIDEGTLASALPTPLALLFTFLQNAVAIGRPAQEEMQSEVKT